MFYDRRSTMLCLALCAALFTPIPARAANYGAPVNLSDNSSQGLYNYYIQINDQGQVVWVSSDNPSGSGAFQLNLYDGTATKVIRSTTNPIGPPKINANGDVTWVEAGALWLYTNGAASQVAQNADAPSINDSDQIAFDGEDLTKFKQGIFIYSGGGVTEFTLDFSTNPAINDSGLLVYQDSNWKSATHLANVKSAANQVISLSGTCNGAPEINGKGQAVWLGSIAGTSSCGNTYSVYFYDGATTKIISGNNGDNNALSAWQQGLINATGQVAWLDRTSGDIYMYANGAVQNLTNQSTLYNFAPQINDSGDVVWYGQDPATMNYYLYLYSGGKVQPLTSYEVSNFADDFTDIPAFNNKGQIAYLGAGQQVYLISPSNLWQNATPTGNGWFYLSPFGAFTTNSSPWIYHTTLGWLYPVGTSTDSIWFYDPQWDGTGGWWWTSGSLFPWVYSVTENEWLYYDAKDSTLNVRWFFTTGGQPSTH